MKSMAATPWISSHTRTHLPHRMHFSGSRMMAGLEMSFSMRLRSPRKTRWRTPCSWARWANSQLPLRAQYRQSSGWLLSSSSTIALRVFCTTGVLVCTFMPSAAG
ncbi:MAG: hypothetical protein P4L36_21595 [Holophaga sp.]|nr:hypothetical protein [Holophaga sp.]